MWMGVRNRPPSLSRDGRVIEGRQRLAACAAFVLRSRSVSHTSWRGLRISAPGRRECEEMKWEEEREARVMVGMEQPNLQRSKRDDVHVPS